MDGWYEYFSDVKINNHEIILGNNIYQDLFESEDFNREYNDFFISRLKINGKYTIIKHISEFNSEERYNYMLIANELTDKIQEEEKKYKEILRNQEC